MINFNDKTLIVPDAYDPISAKVIEMLGFKAVQCSGYSISISKCYKNEPSLTLEENLETTRSIVKSVSIPVFADGEDGYGKGELFENNIEKFINTGISAINIEDQILWEDDVKKGLHPLAGCIEKIKYIKNNYPDIIINARTDAIITSEERSEGISEAIRRANLYYEAGADLCFPTGIKTRDEIKLLNAEINGPLSVAAGLPYNIEEFNINDCRELGVARVSLPSVMIFSSIGAQIDYLQSVKESGTFDADKLVDMELLKRLIN